MKPNQTILDKLAKLKLSNKALAKLSDIPIRSIDDYRFRGGITTENKILKGISKHEGNLELKRAKRRCKNFPDISACELIFHQKHGWVVDIHTNSKYVGIAYSVANLKYVTTIKLKPLSDDSLSLMMNVYSEICDKLNGI